MDLLEFVAQEMKKGKDIQQIRDILIKNGYPLYDVDNALAVEAQKKDEKGQANSFGNVFGKIKGLPGYVFIFAMSIILIIVGIGTLVFYALQ